jgi:hypothetical protein
MTVTIGRRELLAALGGAPAAWPLAAEAQQADRMRRIGVLAGYERPLPEHEAFRKQLQELGYIEAWSSTGATASKGPSKGPRGCRSHNRLFQRCCRMLSSGSGEHRVTA